MSFAERQEESSRMKQLGKVDRHTPMVRSYTESP